MKLKPVRCRQRPATPAPPSLPNGELAQIRNSLRFAEVPTDHVRPPSRDVRHRNQRQAAAYKAHVQRCNLVFPILVGRDGTIVVGVSFWMAAKELGHTTVPVLYAENQTPDELRHYRIAYHKLISMGGWDEDALAMDLKELGELALALDLDLKLDLQLTGFSTREIDEITLRDRPEQSETDAADGTDDLSPAPVAVSRPGDLWLVGEHKVLNADSQKEESLNTLLGNERAQIVICDGPYNCPVRGHVSSRKDSREFAFASGEMSSGEFINFERTVMSLCAKYSIDGSIHYHFIDWRMVYEMIAAGREVYTEHKNVLVWVKGNAARGWYRSQFELCCVFKNGTAPHITTFGIEKGARWRSNVLTGYPSCNSFGAHRDEDLADHPTVKGTSLIADLLRDCSSRGGIALDVFGGSGTLLLASELTGRRARLIEIDPLYVDVIIRRAARRCGLEAVLAATGQTFEEVARERLGNAADLALGLTDEGFDNEDDFGKDENLEDEEAIDD
ncbi:DNA modification methylase [Tsuneonella sp. HG249]